MVGHGTYAERSEKDLAAGKCDLIAVGRPFLVTPDLVERWKTGADVNAPDMDTFYTPGAKGYTDIVPKRPRQHGRFRGLHPNKFRNINI